MRTVPAAHVDGETGAVLDHPQHHSRVAALMLGWVLIPHDTVWCETPASTAISRILGGGKLHLCPTEDSGRLGYQSVNTSRATPVVHAPSPDLELRLWRATN